MDRTKPQLDALTADCFALPVHRKYPIEDGDDLAFALKHADEWHDPGMVRGNAIRLARKRNIIVPEEYKDAHMSFSSGLFSADLASEVGSEIGAKAHQREDGRWIREGKYFEVNREFTDMHGHKYMLPMENALDTVTKFEPCNVNLQHAHAADPVIDYLFADNWPQIEGLRIEASDVIATYSVPDWFQKATDGKPVPTSSEWDMTTHMPVGGAYCMKGAVPDSVMFAAFAEATVSDMSDRTAYFKKFDTATRKKLATSHDAMADGSFPILDADDVKNAVHDWGRAGSKASVKEHIIKRARAIGATDELPEDWDGSSKKKDANMADKDDNKGDGKLSPVIQHCHDRLADGGAPCSGKSMFSIAAFAAMSDAEKAEFAKPEHMKQMQKMHDMCPKEHCDHYATMRSDKRMMYSETMPVPTAPEPEPQRGNFMSKFGDLIAKFRKAGLSEADADKAAKVAAGEEPVVTPATDDASVKFAQMIADMNKSADERVKSIQAEFATQLKDRDDKIAELAKKNADDDAAAQLNSHNNAIDRLVEYGSMTAAQGETYKKIAEKHPAVFAEQLETLKALPRLQQFSELGGYMVTPPSDMDGGELTAKVAKYAEEHNVNFAEAALVVMKKDRAATAELAQEFREMKRRNK